MDDLQYSRVTAAIASLGETAENHHRFLKKRVLVTGAPEALATVNGQDCFKASLHLLIRICPNISVYLPSGFSEFSQICQLMITPLLIDTSVEFLSHLPNLNSFDAILSIGGRAKAELPWSVINSDGWLARFSSGASDIPITNTHNNPIGAFAAAAFGVGEVFKFLFQPRPDRGSLLDGGSFNLFSYESGTPELGPALPTRLVCGNLLQIGGGAIGNGIVYLLRNLPLVGQLTIVDRQNFGIENWSTSIILGPNGIGQSKAGFLAHLLTGPELQANGIVGEFEALAKRIGQDIPYPKIVLTALDNIEARHAVQHIWPDLLIDGAISDFACQVSCHPWGENVACLMCLFRQLASTSADLVASKATGLSSERTFQALDVVTEQDVEYAPDEKKEWLSQRVGQQICSVIEEALAQKLSAETIPAGFRPSVPFVACLSAAMMVSELVKALSDQSTALDTRFQFDVLRGPASGFEIPQARRSDCICTTRRLNIEKFRQVWQYNHGG